MRLSILWRIMGLWKEIGELLAKNIARTARRQFHGRHVLFGEYLHY